MKTKVAAVLAAVLLVGGVLLLSLWVALVSSVGLHWWRLPSGLVPGALRLLLAAASAYCLLFAAMAARLARGGGWVGRDDRTPRRLFDYSLLALLLGLTAGWAASSLAGRSSAALLGVILGVSVVDTAGVIVLEYRRLRHKAV